MATRPKRKAPTKKAASKKAKYSKKTGFGSPTMKRGNAQALVRSRSKSKAGEPSKRTAKAAGYKIGKKKTTKPKATKGSSTTTVTMISKGVKAKKRKAGTVRPKGATERRANRQTKKVMNKVLAGDYLGPGNKDDDKTDAALAQLEREEAAALGGTATKTTTRAVPVPVKTSASAAAATKARKSQAAATRTIRKSGGVAKYLSKGAKGKYGMLTKGMGKSAPGGSSRRPSTMKRKKR